MPHDKHHFASENKLEHRQRRKRRHIQFDKGVTYNKLNQSGCVPSRRTHDSPESSPIAQNTNLNVFSDRPLKFGQDYQHKVNRITRGNELQCRTPRKLKRRASCKYALPASLNSETVTACDPGIVHSTSASSVSDSDDSTGTIINSLLPAVSSLLTTCAKPVSLSSHSSQTPLQITSSTLSSITPPYVPTSKATFANTMSHSSPVSVMYVQRDDVETKQVDIVTAITQQSNNHPDEKHEEQVVIPPMTHSNIDASPQFLWLMTSLPSHEHTRLQQHALKSKALLPPKTCNKKITLVLDLDETLVHCGFQQLANADIRLNIDYHGRPYTVFGKRRPYLQKFLREAAQNFELVCFTASQRVYAKRIIDLIDPEGNISHCLFRDSCINIGGNYLKDLSIIGRDLRHTVLVDNSPHAFGFQIENGVPITSWFDNPNDLELLSTVKWLESIKHADDVRPIINEQFRMRDRILCCAAERGMTVPW